MFQSSVSRRRFLQYTGAGALAGATAPLFGQTSAPATPKGQPKNLIFLVSDGMNLGTLSLANHFAEAYKGGSCNWIKLYGSDTPIVRSFAETQSASSLVTDSAAAGSAWSCGRRINNGALNIAPDGEVLTPIYEHAKRAGKATGVVTTTRVTHATPASFIVSDEERNAEDRIARKFLDNGYSDIILGGGSAHFDPAKRDDGNDLFSAFRSRGYTVLRDRESLMAAAKNETTGNRWLGTFFESHLPYTIDRDNVPELTEKVPSLAEMMEAALARLSGAPEGFILQVEGGRVDHAGHANDGPAIIQDQLAFDECIALARRFYEANPDTLVIITTDHGTGGCQLNGMGDRYNDTTELFANTRRVKASFEYLDRLIRKETSPERVREIVGEYCGVDLDSAVAGAIVSDLQSDVRYAVSNRLAPVLFQTTGINFTSNNHTGDLVELVAFGPGAQAIPPYHENYQLTGILRQQMDV